MGYVIAGTIVALAILYAAFWQSGTISRQEEKEHPCETCPRWSECYGVDEQCPWRKKDA